jgi:hypothetical protein
MQETVCQWVEDAGDGMRRYVEDSGGGMWSDNKDHGLL